MHYKKVKSFLLLFLCLLMCSSCGGRSELPLTSVDASSDAEDIQITNGTVVTADVSADRIPAVSVGMDGFISADDGIADIIFTKLGIMLIPVNVREDDYETLSVMDASGTLPDLLRVNTASPFFAGLAETGKLRDWAAVEALQEYPSLKSIMSASDSLAAVRHLYGGQALFMPLANVPAADPGRIYYRKDWLAELGISVPDTADGFADMLRVFYEGKRRPGLTLAGGVTYLIAMFGADPYSWINENDRWIPAYYSEKMIQGLEFARNLFTNNWLDFEFAINKANTAVNKFAADGAGSLIRYGDTLWTRQILSRFAETHGISIQAAYDDHIGVLPPFKTASVSQTAEPAESSPHWPRSIPTAGIIMSKASSDSTAANALALLDFILSDEAAELAVYGIRGKTSGLGENGKIRLFIDPVTTKPFNIIEQYPSAQALFLLGEPFSIPLPPKAQAAMSVMDERYAAAVPNMSDGYLAHFIHSANRKAFEDEVNISLAFNAIVMGEAPAAEMFAAFKTLCDERGIEKVINEVNAKIG